MESTDNVVEANFDEPSKAYQALSMIKEAHASGRVFVRQAAVIERTREGRIRAPEGTDNVRGIGMAGGGLIGMMLGILGGPVGLLLGWGTGALVGGILDARRATNADTGLALLARTLSPGSTALVADVKEAAVEVVDGIVRELGGSLIRRPSAEVLAELEGVEDAARAASDEITRIMRDQRKQARRERREDRLEALKAKLRQADDAFRSL